MARVKISVTRLRAEPYTLKKNKSMNKQELRIGNYVDYEQTTHVITALLNFSAESYWLNQGKGEFQWEGYTCGYDELSGIPLSSEWLERFGFRKDDMLEYYCLATESGIQYVEGDKNGYLEVVLDSDELPVRVRYVHQLQNLHFALTGTELTLGEQSPTP